MPYQIGNSELTALGGALAEYYEEAWSAGVRGLFDKMARGNMGTVTAYLDQGKDTFANLRKTSSDNFGITFKPALKQFIGVQLANKMDVASALVTVAELALSKLASAIPIPHLGTVVSAAISFAATKGREELHTRSVTEADGQLGTKTGGAPLKLFTSDVEAAAYIQASIDQYKLICKFIQTLPASVSNYDDAVTFPGAVFKVQAAASSLNVALVSVRQYLAGMQERLEKIQGVSKDYITSVRRDMPAAVGAVLQAAYQEAYKKGEGDITKGKYSAPPNPGSVQKPAKPGGATQLAAYLAHAVLQGYYDSGNRGPMRMQPPQPLGRHTPPGHPPPPIPGKHTPPGFPPPPPPRKH